MEAREVDFALITTVGDLIRPLAGAAVIAEVIGIAEVRSLNPANAIRRGEGGGKDLPPLPSASRGGL